MAPSPAEPPVPHDLLGTPGRPRAVLLHGFTQNRRCWGPVPGLLARAREVAVADAPGHGDAAGLRLSLADAATPYADALAGVGAAQWVGYSMGGRLALHVALAHPGRVGALVLVGTTPGIADPPARAARRAADEALATHLEAVGTTAFVDEWLAQPLFRGLDAQSACRSERLTNDAGGLASSLRLAGTGAQEPLWASLGEISAPVLLVVGERDEKFRTIAADMAPRFGGRCDTVVLPATGHACHLEAPEAFCDLVTAWLDDAQPGTP
jgi:2-succinyl-6-hydroxy-2,4-cyclohexadiene-1-carboxylate synthase